MAFRAASLRLRVSRRERHSCTDRLLVPDLGLDFPIAAGEAADLLVPAAPRGQYLFTCGQRMVKGVLLFE